MKGCYYMRKLKDSETRTFRSRKDLLEKVDKYSEDTSIPKTAIVEKALELFFKSNDESNQTSEV